MLDEYSIIKGVSPENVCSKRKEVKYMKGVSPDHINDCARGATLY